MEAKARTTSSKFQPDVSSTDESSDKPTSRVRADFEGLLELAEQLQQSYEKRVAGRQSLFVTGQVYSLFLAIELLTVYAAGSFLFLNRINSITSHTSRTTFLICIGFVAVFIPLGMITFFYFNSLRQRSQHIQHLIKADERDIAEVVELLREIEPVFAKEEKLSALERVQIRIRLSRFGIGSSSRGEVKSPAKDMAEEFQSRKSRVDQELMRPF
ncbi:MAG: hypothetical protein ACRYFS_20335 [Janthinobacterium lividum]